MEFRDRLLLENRAWADEMSARDPEYFTRLNHGQAPDALWIGCSDSRVPPEQLCNASPGDLFIHRNVANLVADGEAGFLSVLEYAVHVLAVPHIVVCGHYGCGGVAAACSDEPVPLAHVDAHIEPLKTLRNRHRETLDALDGVSARINRLVELNVRAQIERLAELTLIRTAARPPALHGLVYATDRGLLESVCYREPEPLAQAVPA